MSSLSKPSESNKQSKKKIFRLKTKMRLFIRKSFRHRKRRGTSILYLILTALVIATLIGQAAAGRYENCFTCALTLVLFLIPNFVETRLKITLPQTLEAIIILFIFAAEILGEIRAFYLKLPWWDDMLHTMNGFLMGAVGFSMVDILNKNERFKFHLSPLFIAIVSFCFSMTIGVLWEFFEFFMDCTFATDMQKDTILQSIASVNLNADGLNAATRLNGIESVTVNGRSLMINGGAVDGGSYAMSLGGYLDIGLYDTMNDLLVNFIGAAAFSVIGYFYIKTRGKGKFIKRFIPRLRRGSAKTTETNALNSAEPI